MYGGPWCSSVLVTGSEFMAVNEEIVGVKPLTCAQNFTADNAAGCTVHRV